MKRLFSGVVSSNEPDGPYRVLCLDVGQDIAPQPGQFVQVRCGPPSSTDPLLLRPFSLSDWEGDSAVMTLLVHPVGRASAWLGNRVPGETVDFMGPLGRGFPLQPTARGDDRAPQPSIGPTAVLLAGGSGVAPMPYLASCLGERGWSVVSFLGASSRTALARVELLRQRSAALYLATDDGSEGLRGTVVDAFHAWRRSRGMDTTCTIFACGPRAMLAEVHRLSRRDRIDTYLSLEERMACGVGACLGCAVPRGTAEQGERYWRVCAEGPVFRAGEVRL